MKRTYILGSVALAILITLGLLVTLIATGVIGTSAETLVFSSASHEAIYSGSAVTCQEWKHEEGQLQEGHTAHVTWQGSQTDVGTSDNTFTVTIKDENGANVSDDYDIVYKPGKLTVFPCELHVTADNASKQYDGKPLSNSNYMISGGMIILGHYLQVEVTGERTEVGQSDNNIAVHVFDSEGRDVTSNYRIITEAGDLTVIPHAITLQSGNAEREYDGTSLTLDQVELTAGELVKDHTLNWVMTGTQTNAGTSQNTFAVEILDKDGKNVTHNYAITTVFGELKVKPRTLRLESETQRKTYDGTAIETLPEHIKIKEGSVADGQTANIVITSSLTRANSISYEYDISIVDADEKDVTTNYDIDSSYGKLIISKREVTIRSDDAAKDYDGTPLTCTTWKYTSDTKVVEGETLEAYISGTRTEIGESQNTIAELIVRNAAGENVTDCYIFTKELGALVVRDEKTEDGKRLLVITANSTTFVYDGTAHSDDGYTVTDPGKNVGLIEGHRLDVTIEGSITDVDTIPNRIVRVIIYNNANEKVYDSDNGIDNGIYEVKTVDGELTVTPRPVYVIVNDATKIYDDSNALSGDEVTYEIIDSADEKTGLLEDHNFSAIVVGSTKYASDNQAAIEAGVIWETILDEESIVIMAGDDNVRKNYQVEVTPGALTIERRALAVTAPDATKLYNGTDVVPDVYITLDDTQPVNGGLLPEHTLTGGVLGDRINVGEGMTLVDPDTFTVQRSGEDVSQNYTYTQTTGVLTIDPCPVTVKADDYEKVYNDTFATNAGVTAISGLAENHTVKAIVDGTEKYSGTSGYTVIREESVVILDAAGQPVTDNYIVTTAPGILTIRPRPIVITADTAEKKYDGKPLISNLVSPSPDAGNSGLILGHEIISFDVVGSQTEIGSSPNVAVPDSIVIKNEKGEEVQLNYAFSYEEGTLTVNNGSTIPVPPEGNVTVAYITTTYSGYVFLRQYNGGLYIGQDFAPATPYIGDLIDGKYSMNYLTGLALATHPNYRPYEATIETVIPTATGYMVPGSLLMDSKYFAQTNDVASEGEFNEPYTQGYYVIDVLDLDAFLDVADSIRVPQEYAAYEAAYREFVYSNPQYTFVPESTLRAIQEVVDTFDREDERIVGIVAEYIRNSLKYNLEYNKKSDNIDNAKDIAAAVLTKEYTEGVCRHYAIAATMLYRALGIPARYTVGYAAETAANFKSPVNSKSAHAWVEVYFDNIGWVTVDVTGSDGLGGNGSDENIANSLKLKPEDLYMKYTDGSTSLAPIDKGEDGFGTRVEGGKAFATLLTQGYTYTVRYSGRQTKVGIGESKIAEFHLYDPTGVEVTDQFVIEYNPGKLHLFYEELRITSGSLAKEYDGTPLYDPGRDTGTGYMLEGQLVTEIDGLAVHHRLEVSFNASIENIGYIANYFTSKVYDVDTGEDVTYMYKINSINGLLYVHGRKIVVTAGSLTKTDDGTPLSCPDYYYDETKLFDNHVLEAKTKGEITEGRGSNIIEYVLIYDKDDPDKTPLNDIYYDIEKVDGILRIK